jgi:hypothetical protein
MIVFCRRPVPVGAEDIGTWLVILQMTSLAAVITNAGILCYTMKLITFSGVGTVWLFVGFQYSIFVAMALFAYLVDDVPADVSTCNVSFDFFFHGVFLCFQVVLQLQRQDYLAARAEMSPEDLAAEKRRERRATQATLAVVPHIQVEDIIIHFSFNFCNCDVIFTDPPKRHVCLK